MADGEGVGGGHGQSARHSAIICRGLSRRLSGDLCNLSHQVSSSSAINKPSLNSFSWGNVC